PNKPIDSTSRAISASSRVNPRINLRMMNCGRLFLMTGYVQVKVRLSCGLPVGEIVNCRPVSSTRLSQIEMAVPAARPERNPLLSNVKVVTSPESSMVTVPEDGWRILIILPPFSTTCQPPPHSLADDGEIATTLTLLDR